MATLSYEPAKKPSKDQADSLRMMAIFYFIWGGMSVVGSLAMAIGTWNDPEMDWPVAISAVYSVSVFLSACFIRTLRFRLFSLIVASITAVAFPVGTILGVYTIYLLATKDAGQLYLDAAAERRQAQNSSG